MDDSVIELSSFCSSSSSASRHSVTYEESPSVRSDERNKADRANGGSIIATGKAGRQSPAESLSASIVDLDSSKRAEQDDGISSSSSSSSSGVPGQRMWPIGAQTKKSASAGDGVMGPPEVIKFDLNNSAVCQQNRMTSSKSNKPAKKKSLTNESRTITDENSSCDSTTLGSRATSSHKKTTTTAKPRRKKRQWGRKKTPDGSDMSTTAQRSGDDGPKKKASSDQESKHYHCYLLRSLDPGHPLKTYIGFTTNPERRLRQHNGDLKCGGARRTKRAGRPWTFVCVVHG